MAMPIRRVHPFAALAAALTLGAGVVVPPTASQARAVAAPDAAAATPERARLNGRVFDAVWNSVRRLYYDPSLRGVDWRAARSLYRPQAIAAADDRALYRVLGEMLDLLDDDHAGALSPAAARRQDALRTRRAVIGVTMAREDGGRWRIQSVRPGSPAAEAGIEPDWVFDTVDGRSWGVDFDVEAGVPLRLDLIDADGASRSVTVTPRLMDPTPAFTADASRPGVLVLRIEGFEAGLGRWLGAQLAGLPAETDVILDLRGNPGGLLLEADAVLSCFLPADTEWATRISRSGRPLALKVMPACGDLAAPIPNDLALLVDDASRSAAELTPVALQEAGRALVVGERTAGAVLISQESPLPDGGRLTLSRADYVTAGGVRLEKRGVLPDIEATRSREDRLADRDPVMEVAVAVLALDAATQRAAARRPSL